MYGGHVIMYNYGIPASFLQKSYSLALEYMHLFHSSMSIVHTWNNSNDFTIIQLVAQLIGWSINRPSTEKRVMVDGRINHWHPTDIGAVCTSTHMDRQVVWSWTWDGYTFKPLMPVFKSNELPMRADDPMAS